MINVNRYNELMKELTNIFPSIDTKIIDSWLKYLKNCSDKQLENAVHKAITTCKKAPTLAEILEFMKNSQVNMPTQYNEKEDCEYCKGLGFHIVKHLIDDIPYDYLCYCKCKNGNKWNVDSRKCKDEKNRSEYFSKRIDEVIPDFFDLPIHKEEKPITKLYIQEKIKELANKMGR